MIQFYLKFVSTLIFLTILLASSACKGDAQEINARFLNKDGGQSPAVTLEVANNAQSRKTGLMYRKDLSANGGMIFIFEDEKRRNFWMKNTYLELDIIYINSKREVVSVISKAAPLTESPRDSIHPAQYVVEVRGGLAQSWNVVPGSMLEVSGEMPIPKP